VDITGRRPRSRGEPDVAMQLLPVHGGAGEMLGWALVVSEITERKRFEKELTDARDAAEAANRARISSWLCSATSCARRFPPC